LFRRFHGCSRGRLLRGQSFVIAPGALQLSLNGTRDIVQAENTDRLDVFGLMRRRASVAEIEAPLALPGRQGKV
jgi:hypothetical protein